MSARASDATSSPLTVDSATKVFEGLLSAEENSETRETPPAEVTTPESDPAEAAADADVESEQSEPEAEQPEGETEDGPTEPEPPQVFTLEIDGKPVSVTLDELKKGHLRQSDYTRKTQALADERKALEPVKAERLEIANRLRALDEQLAQIQPQEPDWEALQRDNPEEAPRVWMQWQRWQQHREKVQADRAAAEKKVAADQAESMKQYVDAERVKLLDKIPSWKDAAVAKKEQAELVTYAESQGITAEQLAGITDHVPLVVLRKAMLHDRAQQAKPAVRQKIEAVKVATPGSAAGRKPVSDATKANQRLAKTGRPADAAAAFMHLLDDD